MKERWHTRFDFRPGFEPVASLKNVSGAFLFAWTSMGMGQERHGRRAFRPLLPERLDLFVCLLEIRNSGSPVAKHGRGLGGAALVASDLEDFTHRSWHRIGHDIAGARHGK